MSQSTRMLVVVVVVVASKCVLHPVSRTCRAGWMKTGHLQGTLYQQVIYSPVLCVYMIDVGGIHT